MCSALLVVVCILSFYASFFGNKSFMIDFTLTVQYTPHLDQCVAYNQQNVQQALDNVVLPVDTCVAIVGLHQDSQHNGRRGIIVKVDHEQRRYVVITKLPDSDDVTKWSVKWENVRA